MSGHEFVEIIRNVIDYAATGIEFLAVAVIISGVIVVAISRGTIRAAFRVGKPGEQERYAQVLGRPLLLALDLLVAGDLVKTVSLEPTPTNIASLGLLVVVRTFLSWALVVEIEGHWPWQGHSGQK